MSIKERILVYLNYKKVNKNTFYRVVEVANGYLDKQSAVNSDVLARIIIKYPDLNYRWLLLGEGEMLEIPQGKNRDSVSCSESCLLKDYVIQLQKDKIQSLEEKLINNRLLNSKSDFKSTLI